MVSFKNTNMANHITVYSLNTNSWETNMWLNIDCFLLGSQGIFPNIEFADFPQLLPNAKTLSRQNVYPINYTLYP